MPGYELIDEQERLAVNEVFDRGGVLFSVGFDALRQNVFRVREFESAFGRRFETKFAHAVSSGTAAIKVALKALGVGRGDEVITQCFTFVATVEAILESGATPVITEVDETLTMDPEDLAARIGPKTRAIMPVHMLGAPARMSQIMEIARAHDLLVLEDTAQACGGTFQGKYLGTLGNVGMFSFDFGKVMTTGEGGMLTTNNHDVHLMAKEYSDHGHQNNPAFPRGSDTRRIHGFNYRMTELAGAIGLVQLGKLESALQTQRRNKKKIKSALSDIPSIRFRSFADENGEIGDTLVFFLENPQLAGKAAESLASRNVRFKILPEALDWHFAGTWSHMLSPSNGFKGTPANLWTRSSNLLRSAIAVPILIRMDDAQIERIIDSLRYVLTHL